MIGEAYILRMVPCRRLTHSSLIYLGCKFFG